MSAKVCPEVLSDALWKTFLLSSKTNLRKSYWISFLHRGTPSSFFRCLILFPEYTELTLPLALRRVVVVVAVYIGVSLSLSFSFSFSVSWLLLAAGAILSSVVSSDFNAGVGVLSSCDVAAL